MGDLSEHFSRAEFACKCGCGLNNVKPELIYHLELFRGNFAECLGYEAKIEIISGCRCPAHNADVFGTSNSAHLTGEAADIKIIGLEYSGYSRYQMAQAALEVGFDRIGLGTNKFHLDVSMTLPRPALWIYEKK